MTVKTQNGYDLHELLSALQKCIRRGLEEQAVYFAVELDGFGINGSGSTMLWNRLRINCFGRYRLCKPVYATFN